MIAGGVVYGVMIGMAFTEQVDIFSVLFFFLEMLHCVFEFLIRNYDDEYRLHFKPL